MAHTIAASRLNAYLSMVLFGCSIVSIIKLISPAKLSRELSKVLTPFYFCKFIHCAEEIISGL